MYQGLVHAHSGMRWIVVAFLLLSLIQLAFSKPSKFVTLGTLISFHIQVLIGIALYFMSNKVIYSGDWIKNEVLRFYGMEHIIIMLIAAIFITLGYRQAKKKNYKAYMFFLLVTVVLVIVGVPWPFREGLGAGWF